MDEDSIADDPIPSKSSQLIGQLAQPLSNLGSNISRTYGMFSNGQIGDGVKSLIGTVKSPYSDPYSSGANQQQPSLPTLSDEHLGEPDSNGFRAINDTGQQFLQKNYQPQMAQQSDVQIPQIQQAPQQKSQKGMIGKTADNLLATYTGGLL